MKRSFPSFSVVSSASAFKWSLALGLGHAALDRSRSLARLA